MHLTLKKETTKPPAYNLLQQQEMFDYFTKQYNEERPHQGINMKYPAQLYTPSSREYKGLSDIDYPLHDKTITITTCGRICIGRRKINLSSVFAGQKVGIREVEDKIWLVSFMNYDIGFFDEQENRIEPVGQNPFNEIVLPMSSV